MPLTQKHFDEIEQLLILHLNTPAKREMAVLKIFMGTTKQPPHIDYTGDTQEACFWIVKAFADYDEIETKKPALWFLLEYMKQYYGETALLRISELQKLALNHYPQTDSRRSKAKYEVDSPNIQTVWRNLTVAQAIIIATVIIGLVSVLLVVAPDLIGVVDELPTLVVPESPTRSIVSATPRSTISPTATLPPTETMAVAFERALAGVGSNNEWVPYIQAFNDVEMVLVPRGCFIMGSEDGEVDETPIHQVCFDTPFWIDRFEVTARQFAQLRSRAGQTQKGYGSNLPRNSITWYEARDYCVLREGRLPTEAEWEYAARGVDNLIYPWGNIYDDTKLNDINNNEQDVYEEAAPADAFENGVSWVGAYQMSGNVWEWVSTIYDIDRFPYPYTADDGRENTSLANVWRVLRGGSWNLEDFNTRAASRYYYTPQDTTRFWGTRCARDFEG